MINPFLASMLPPSFLGMGGMFGGPGAALLAMLTGSASDDFDTNMLISELMGGSVEVGVGDVDKAIEKVASPTHSVCNDDKCPICYEALLVVAKEDSIVRTVPCQHMFCDTCIRKWLRSSRKCPVCMTDLDGNAKDEKGEDEGRRATAQPALPSVF